MNPADKAILNPPKRVASLADISDAWIAQVRGIIQAGQHKLRAGFPACIEVRGPHDWQPLLLPTNGIEFEGKRVRDEILRRLTA